VVNGEREDDARERERERDALWKGREVDMIYTFLPSHRMIPPF
jgi:hypothetical protein